MSRRLIYVLKIVAFCRHDSNRHQKPVPSGLHRQDGVERVVHVTRECSPGRTRPTRALNAARGGKETEEKGFVLRDGHPAMAGAGP